MGAEPWEMNSHQWQEAWRIFEIAQELDPSERRAFIASESADPEVVERVLELLAEPTEEDPVAPSDVNRTGTRVSRYEVAGLVGRGGMGEVYAARDTELNRPVALKFLTAGRGDPAAVKRFVREAKATSALNHPNILTVHEVIQSPSGLAIAMELVEGKAVSELRGTALPIPQVIELGRQAASALAAAHKQGIVHRDIKPENLMVRPDGLVKVLDFGLAHDFAGQLAATLQPSAGGLPAGTLRYMSPEQLRGAPVTGASDVFSLGIVLYELAVGVHPFQSEYAWETAYAIHTREPAPPSTMNRAVPGWLDDVLLSMLHRDPDARPSAQQIEARFSNPGGDIRPWGHWRTIRVRFLQPRTRSAVAVVVSLMTALGLAAWLWIVPRGLPRDEALKVVPLAAFAGSKGYPALSPDGNRVAFSWQAPGSHPHHIYVKPVGEGDPVQLTFSSADDVRPAWSPDGKQIAFCRQPDGDQPSVSQEIYIVPADGGKERKIVQAWRGVSWSVDGKTLALAHVPNEAIAPARESGGIFLLSLESGRARDLTVSRPDSFPVFSPNGKWITFKRQVSGTVAALFVVPAAGGPERQLTSNPYPIRGPAWTADSSEIVFSSLRSGADGSLWRVPVTGGVARPVSATLRDASDPSISPQGRLAYREEWNDTNLYLFTARSFHGDAPAGFGEPVSVVNASREDHSPDFSPDGERIAFVSDRSGYLEIWAASRNGTKQVQLTSFRAQNAGSPRWSPDGRQIAFDSWASGKSAVYLVDSSGGVPRAITSGSFGSWMPSWSPDGEWIYCSRGRSGPSEIWKLPAAGGDAVQVTHSGAFESRTSPDGRLVYYSKPTEGGRSIWSVPASGGVESPVSELEKYRGVGRCWGVIDEGIYFVSYEESSQQTVRFLSFRTRKVTPLFSLQKQEPWGVAALTFSRDGHYALATQLDHAVNDLMMIENFR
jgi:Tol biopolymer transport system component